MENKISIKYTTTHYQFDNDEFQFWYNTINTFIFLSTFSNIYQNNKRYRKEEKYEKIKDWKQR